jgi:hypothetical protein
VTSLLSRPTLNEWVFVRLQAVCVSEVSQFDMQRNVSKGVLLMFLRTFFGEEDDFVRATKIVPREKNTENVKKAPKKLIGQ